MILKKTLFPILRLGWVKYLLIHTKNHEKSQQTEKKKKKTQTVFLHYL